MPEPSGSEVVWHDTILGTAADSVPDLIDRTNDLVQDFLDQNQAWANSAIATANAAIVQLSVAGLPINLPDPPSESNLTVSTILGGGLGESQPPNLGSIQTEAVAPFTADDIVIPDIDDEIPEYVSVITGLTIPEAPAFVSPTTPLAPDLDLSFDVGSEPTPDYGLPPDLAALDLPTYVPVILPLFNDDAPEFTTLPPSPIIQWVEPVYSSDVRDAIKIVLAEMLAGGTGLPSAVEQAIWDRGRQREDAGTLKLVVAATDQWTSRGFAHPPGQLNGQTIAVREEGERKVNELSREIMVKQADLEQTNRQFAVTSGITYEQVFVGMFMQIVDRNFQIAKFQVETAIQIFNMQVSVFNVQQAVFAQKIEKYKVDLEAALAPLKVYQVLIEGEKAKAQMNESIVSAFKAMVDAYGKQVDAYKARVDAEVARASQQKLLVDIYKSQVDAMVSETNVQRGMFEAYSARVGGETAKAGLEESNARVYNSKVQAFAAKSEVGFKRAEAQIATNRLRLDWQIANLNRIATLNGQQLSEIQANLSAYQAATGRASAEFNATTTIKQAEIQNLMEMGRLGLGKYQAMLEQWRTRGTQILAAAQIQAESLRAAGQIASNLAAGAMAGTHVSAGISGGASATQNRSDTKSESKSFAQGIRDDVSVTFSHPYKPI